MVKIRKFKLFPKLSPELRQMIFELALPDGQLISVSDGVRETTQGLERIPSARYTVPALLHVNREARCFADRFYQKMFPNGKGGNPVYIDIARDILVLKYHWETLQFIGINIDDMFHEILASSTSTTPAAESLPMIAFHYRPAHINPKVFQVMGSPKKIFGLIPDCLQDARQSEFTNRVQSMWTNATNIAIARGLPVCTVEILMLKELKARLGSGGPTRKLLPATVKSKM